MIKRITCLVMALLLVLILSGCWSYRGLNDMSIVSGFAVDRSSSDGQYMLTLEIVDIKASPKTSGVKAVLYESQGKTIFDAIRNVKRKLSNKPYFGNTQIIIISQQIAKDGGLTELVDYMLRDAEFRETTSIVVSNEYTAKEILKPNEARQSLISFDIASIIEDDAKISGSTIQSKICNIFNTLRSPGVDLVLPAFHRVPNIEEEANETDGVAIFSKDAMLGSLTADQTKYFLYAMNKIKGGVILFDGNTDGQDDTVLEVIENKTKTEVKWQDGRLHVAIKTSTKATLIETGLAIDPLDEEQMDAIRSAAEQTLAGHIQEVIAQVQTQYGADIFGFGNQLYREQPEVWAELAPQWNDIFRTAEVTVVSEISIVNTNYTGKS